MTHHGTAKDGTTYCRLLPWPLYPRTRKNSEEQPFPQITQGISLKYSAMDHSGMGNMASDESYGTHMTFFWGKNSEILFSGWPGTRGGMYALALVVVFLLAVFVEWFNFCRVVRPRWGHAAAGLAQTALYAVRVGLAYMVMLAVMSFNVGVLIAVILGHALGFLLFGSSVFQARNLSTEGTKGDLPPISCAC